MIFGDKYVRNNKITLVTFALQNIPIYSQTCLIHHPCNPRSFITQPKSFTQSLPLVFRMKQVKVTVAKFLKSKCTTTKNHRCGQNSHQLDFQSLLWLKQFKFFTKSIVRMGFSFLVLM